MANTSQDFTICMICSSDLASSELQTLISSETEGITGLSKKMLELKMLPMYLNSILVPLRIV
jgi:hypothetical protein